MSDIRDSIVEEAIKAQDLRAAIPETRQQFRELLGPPPKGASWDLSVPFSCKLVNGKYVTKGVSTCALAASGLMRRAGMPLPWNGSPYWQFPSPYTGLDIMSALSRLGQVYHVAAIRRPLPGEVFCIGSGLGTHAGTCIADDGVTVTSVDGGQIDDYSHSYLQRMKVCRRVWANVRVNWVLDTDKLYGLLTTATGVIIEAWTVRDTQAALVRHGFDPGPVDGISGMRTRAAIVRFQAARGLTPDGVVGPLTRAEMQK